MSRFHQWLASAVILGVGACITGCFHTVHRPRASVQKAIDATPIPTHAELAELAAVLVVPIAGIDPATLPDTFNETRGNHRHEALDILAPHGTPVRSAAAGRLLKRHRSKMGGLMIYAADPSGRFALMYAHLDGYAANLKEGMPLRQGQIIGYVGTTGNAPPITPHLHFAIARTGEIDRWWRGTAVNPWPLLAKKSP